MSRVVRKPVFWISNQGGDKLACTATEGSKRLDILDLETRDIILSRQRKTKALIFPFVFGMCKNKVFS